MRDGEVEFVEVQSRLGETCRLRNPWDGSGAVVQDGGGARLLADSTLCFDTRAGVNYRLLPAGRPEPVQRSITATPTTEPTAFRATLPSGTTVEGTLGRMAENPVRTDC
jgi:hypothetical protein